MANEEASGMGEWASLLPARGRLAFSLEEAKTAFAGRSPAAVRLALNRLSKKGKVLPVHRGYYLVIPAQHSMRGILPPALFVDGLMRHLGRPYYACLLSAAAFHGAAHQQAQEFFVATGFPALRPLVKKGVKVNFISKAIPPESLLESRNTEAGFLKISSPALTAADLVQFEKRIGGLNRAAAVLVELAEVMLAEQFSPAFTGHVPVAVLQRLGWLLEKAAGQPGLAQGLYENCRHAGLRFHPVPLKASGKKGGFPVDERWKVAVNAQIDVEA